MKYVQSIPLWRANGELLASGDISRVVLSSVDTRWNDVVVEQRDFTSIELIDVMFKQHVIFINDAHSIAGEYKKEGRFRHRAKAPGAISFWPSHHPFSLRLKVERGVLANGLFLALDPLFVRRSAEGLELDIDRVELVEQRLATDPTLYHIAMALRAGTLSGAALDRMYGEALSTALAVHLLREFGATAPRPKRQCGGLPRKNLVRAVEYIQDQLDTDLRVSGIARAVGMSCDHFGRLFKESTGKTPHHYVVEARVRKAKELLTTGKFTISEVAYQVGFVDQSHLTRHFKGIFGLTPKKLLKC